MRPANVEGVAVLDEAAAMPAGHLVALEDLAIVAAAAADHQPDQPAAENAHSHRPGFPAGAVFKPATSHSASQINPPGSATAIWHRPNSSEVPSAASAGRPKPLRARTPPNSR